LPVDDAAFHGENLIALFSLIGKSQLLEYRDFGTLIDEIKDEGAGGTGNSKNNKLFVPHVDVCPHPHQPDFLLMLRCRNAEKGGESLFCDVRQIIQNLSCDMINTLQQEVEFMPFPGHLGDPLHAPIFCFDKLGRFQSIRYRRDRINEAKLSREQLVALNEMDAAIQENSFKIKLNSGSFALLDNHMLLHGREAFEGKNRLAWRVYARPS